MAIELVRHQYSGNAYGVIKGIGVVTCVYVNPELDQFWLIDYRIYDLKGDGKSKLGHVDGMLSHTVLSEGGAILRRADGHLVCHKALDVVD